MNPDETLQSLTVSIFDFFTEVSSNDEASEATPLDAWLSQGGE